MNKSKTSNSYLLYAGAIIVVIGLLIFAVTQSKSEPSIYGDFAQCLTEQGTTMYGAWWCPHCDDQKDAFGDAFGNINYVECSDPGKRNVSSECTEAGIEGFPTWIFGDGQVMPGQVPMETLSSLTGCELPEGHEYNHL
jgi:hypothetical protein